MSGIPPRGPVTTSVDTAMSWIQWTIDARLVQIGRDTERAVAMATTTSKRPIWSQVTHPGKFDATRNSVPAKCSIGGQRVRSKRVAMATGVPSVPYSAASQSHAAAKSTTCNSAPHIVPVFQFTKVKMVDRKSLQIEKFKNERNAAAARNSLHFQLQSESTRFHGTTTKKRGKTQKLENVAAGCQIYRTC